MKNGKLEKDPFVPIVRPGRWTPLPNTLRWDAVEKLLDGCQSLREKVLVAPGANQAESFLARSEAR